MKDWKAKVTNLMEHWGKRTKRQFKFDTIFFQRKKFNKFIANVF